MIRGIGHLLSLGEGNFTGLTIRCVLHIPFVRLLGLTVGVASPGKASRTREKFRAKLGSSRVCEQLLTKRLMLLDSRSEARVARVHVSRRLSCSSVPPSSQRTGDLFLRSFSSIWPTCFAPRYTYEKTLDVSLLRGRTSLATHSCSTVVKHRRGKRTKSTVSACRPRSKEKPFPNPRNCVLRRGGK